MANPAEAIFRFNVPLEDRAFRWLCYRDNGHETFTPPGLGEIVEPRVGLLSGNDGRRDGHVLQYGRDYWQDFLDKAPIIGIECPR